MLCTIPGTRLMFNSVGCSKSLREVREKRTRLKKRRRKEGREIGEERENKEKFKNTKHVTCQHIKTVTNHI